SRLLAPPNALGAQLDPWIAHVGRVVGPERRGGRDLGPEGSAARRSSAPGVVRGPRPRARTRRRPGTARAPRTAGVASVQLKLWPQPQDRCALGLSMENPAPCRPSL